MAERQLATRYGPCVNSCAEFAGMEFAGSFSGFGAGPGWNHLSGLSADRLNTFYSVKSVVRLQLMLWWHYSYITQCFRLH